MSAPVPECCASVVDVGDWPVPTGQDWAEVACLCGYESMPMPRGQAEQLAAAHMKAEDLVNGRVARGARAQTASRGLPSKRGERSCSEQHDTDAMRDGARCPACGASR